MLNKSVFPYTRRSRPQNAVVEKTWTVKTLLSFGTSVAYKSDSLSLVRVKHPDILNSRCLFLGVRAGRAPVSMYIKNISLYASHRYK